VNSQSLSAFIWSVADLLRGDYKQSDYGKAIQPSTILRRLDCVLEATKHAVLAELAAKQKMGVRSAASCHRPAYRQAPFLRQVAFRD
jgi:type I restriction enzyme M protein